MLIKVIQVKEEELEGYKLYLEAMDGGGRPLPNRTLQWTGEDYHPANDDDTALTRKGA